MPQLNNMAKTRVLIDGALQKYLTSVRITGESGKTVVHTMDGNRTFAGFSQGESVKTVEMSYTIPISGPEFDADKYNYNNEFVTLQYFFANKSYAGIGQITSNGTEDSTGATISGTMTWIGEAKPHK